MVLKYLAEFGGITGALTAVLYGAGFLATRAHLNMLGVWTGVPILNEAYLYQGGLFFLNSIFSLASVIALVVSGLVVLYVLKIICSSILRGLGKLSERILGVERIKRLKTRITAWFARRSRSFSSNIPRKTLWLTLLTLILVFSVPVFYGRALSLQNLLFQTKEATKHIPGLARWFQQNLFEGRQEILGFYYGWLIVGTWVTGFLLGYVLQNKHPGHKILQIALGAIFVTQILLLPLNYGILIRPTIYPRAYVNTHETSGEEVWLLFETSEDLIVYQDNPQKKGIYTMKKSEVKGLRIMDHKNILKTRD